MGITGEYSLNQYNPQFLGLTSQAPRASRGENYYNSYSQGIPNTTPQVVNFGILPTKDYEAAQAVIDKGIGVDGFHQASAVTSPYAVNGPEWIGYKTPEKNGTGELIPVIKGREDQITEMEYFA